jgi:hypothetical protein
MIAAGSIGPTVVDAYLIQLIGKAGTPDQPVLKQSA